MTIKKKKKDYTEWQKNVNLLEILFSLQLWIIGKLLMSAFVPYRSLWKASDQANTAIQYYFVPFMQYRL